MIFENKNKDEHIIIATCDCGCGAQFQVQKWIDKDINSEEYYLSLHSSKWDEEQIGVFGILGRRLKRAWYNLRGKDYLYMDVVFKKEDFNEFVNKLDKLRK